MTAPSKKLAILAARRAYYDQGATDAELATREHIKENAIVQWRARLRLPVHKADPRSRSPRRAARMLFYQMGWSDYHIAREQHCHRTAVRTWRLRNGLRPNFVQGFAERHQARPTIPELQGRIRRAVGRALPRDVAEDAAADIMAALFDGTISLDKIEQEARKYGNRVLERFASKFGPRSIDATIEGTEDLRLIDTPVDSSSRDWLEEMGATVW